MTIAINYDLKKNPAGQREVFGADVAMHNWMRAFLRYSSEEKVHLLVADAASFENARETATALGIDAGRLVALDQRYPQQNFGRFDTIFRPDPNARQLLWQRQEVTGNGYAFCGLAHAISGTEAGDILEQYCLAPSSASDAIVCPSRAVQSAIRNFWDNYADYLRARFDANYKCPVDLPIIPLGVDIERIESTTTPAHRAEARKHLGLTDDDIAMLWVGRMSHAIKGHPIAMFQAAERAAELSAKPIHLIMYGYFVPENAEAQFVKLAADICKKAKVSFVSNKDARFPNGIWAAGDIFLSLIDNMQESFGLTPIEAMAAGLPRVISDWNGYRDSVQHGEDGFLVPTTQPPAGQGQALSSLLLSGREVYGGFLAKTALSVATDTIAAGKFIAHLAHNKDERTRIAENARRRVRATYDWKHIIPAYEKLWKELAARRTAEPAPRLHMPQCPDPFTMYATYPTAALQGSDRLSAVLDTAAISTLWSHSINTFGLDVMLSPDDITAVINHVRTHDGIRIDAVLQHFAQTDVAALWRTIGWLLKLGIITRTDA